MNKIEGCVIGSLVGLLGVGVSLRWVILPYTPPPTPPPTPVTNSTLTSKYLNTFTHEDHTYVVYASGYGVGMLHDPSCVCGVE